MEEKKGSPLGDILGKILEHPETLIGVLSLLQGFKDSALGETVSKENIPIDAAVPTFQEVEESGEASLLESEQDTAEEIPVSLPEKPTSNHRKRQILCAIKPYAKSDKQGQIDRILHAAELVELIRKP